jgi:hypothetical protein
MASATSRYKSDINIRGGTIKASAGAIRRIRKARDNGLIPCRQITLKEGERLDVLAGKLLGDGRFWWILAALSDIGWGLQVPPGTRIRIPMDVGIVLGYT